MLSLMQQILTGLMLLALPDFRYRCPCFKGTASTAMVARLDGKGACSVEPNGDFVMYGPGNVVRWRSGTGAYPCRPEHVSSHRLW
jgi:hypothetical protein